MSQSLNTCISCGLTATMCDVPIVYVEYFDSHFCLKCLVADLNTILRQSGFLARPKSLLSFKDGQLVYDS